MATFEQEQEVRDGLIVFINKFSNITPESLIRREELGAHMSFREALPSFKRILDLYSELKEVSLDNIPHTILGQVQGASASIDNILSQIVEFSPAQDNATNVRESLITQIRDIYDGVFPLIKTIISYSGKRDYSTEVSDLLKDLKSKQSEQIGYIEEAKKQSDQILDSIKSAAGQVGVTGYSDYFRKQANIHKDISRKWLIASVIIGIISIWYSLEISGDMSLLGLGGNSGAADQSFAIMLQSAIPRLIIFSILFLGLGWSSRSYRAHRHNQIVNEHRQNALGTFETFVNASGNDETTKNAVLLKATEVIFSPVNSGYLGGKEGESAGSSKIVEVIRGVISKNPENIA